MLSNYLAFLRLQDNDSQSTTEIDPINAKILQVLQEDGRISNAALADRVGLSGSACLRRVQELERKGTIQSYRAVLNRDAIGPGFVAYVADFTIPCGPEKLKLDGLSRH